MRARLFTSAILCAVAIALMTTVGAEAPVPLAAPKPHNQIGFPAELYSWVIPADNPQTPAKVELGRKLFFDDRLSADGTVSCDQCHAPAKGFTDQLPTSMGIHHAFGQRNAPTVLNALFNTLQFWDGRAPTLEKQIEGPILNPVEMGNKSFDDVVAKVKAISEYQQSFQTVFNGAVTMDNIEKAIAAYERTQIGFRYALRPLYGGRPERDQCQRQARMVTVQRQGPLHDLPRMEPDAAAVHRQSFS